MNNDTHAITSVSFFQKVIIVVAGLIVPFFVVYSLTTAGTVSEAPTVVIDVAENIKPLAAVEVAPDRANYIEMSGEDVVNQSCAACHTTGLMNAPKIGEAIAWKARIAQGLKTLTKHAIEGIRTMPARGGNPDLTDNEMAKAVVYMANQSGADFAAPKAAEEVTKSIQ